MNISKDNRTKELNTDNVTCLDTKVSNRYGLLRVKLATLNQKENS